MLAVLQPLQRRQTIQTRHLQVQQQDIRLKLLQDIQHLPTVLGLGYDLEILLQRQQPAQSVAKDRVVIRHHDSDFRRFAGCRHRSLFQGAIVFRHKLPVLGFILESE